MTALLDLLAEPFGYQFMVKAILGGGAVGAVCAVLSCFVTLKGWSLLGDAQIGRASCRERVL